MVRVYATVLLIGLLLLGIVPGMAGQDEGLRNGKFDSMHIGAFDPEAWNGIVFDGTLHQQRMIFALRVGSKSGGFIDGDRVFDAVTQVGPHAPDGSYASLSWHHAPRANPITMEWARVDDETVVGRLKASSDTGLVLETYSPFEASSLTTYHLGQQQTEIVGDRFVEGIFGAAAHLLVKTDRSVTGAATFADVGQLTRLMESGELAGAGEQYEKGRNGAQYRRDEQYAAGAAGLEFVADDKSPAHFVAVVGWDLGKLSGRANELLTPGRIDAILDANARRYEQSRPHIEGLFAGATIPIGNTMFWNSLYVPALELEFPSISRRWAKIFGGWVVGEWDCFFGTLLTNVEDASQTAAATRAILLSQAPNGIVPNVASGAGTSPDRNEPPIGSYVVLKNYAKNKDLALLRWVYPRLKKWHEYWFHDRGDGQPWRDGNRDGLLEWGSDKGSTPSNGGRGNLQSAKWESGMDDSPMYDQARYDPNTYTMDLDDVGLNSLYALDSECMAKIAEILGNRDDWRVFMADYDRMKAAIQKLWNDQDGIFENRYWDGSFSTRLSPTNFYPLLAGVATSEQADTMIKKHLLNPKEFWGLYVIPTISRDDPAFEQQFYWRGDIWPPTNYLVYEGLNRYAQDGVALEFAQKSYALFKTEWDERKQHSEEQYSAWGGAAGGDRHYTWGTLMCLMPVEQFIDQTPWDGLRFGALDPPSESVLSNYRWNQHRYTITIAPNRTAIERDGKLRLEANAGIVIRNFQLDTDKISFTTHGSRRTSLTIREFASAPSALTIDNQPTKPLITRDGATIISLSSGTHRVAGIWKEAVESQKSN